MQSTEYCLRKRFTPKSSHHFLELPSVLRMELQPLLPPLGCNRLRLVVEDVVHALLEPRLVAGGPVSNVHARLAPDCRRRPPGHNPGVVVIALSYSKFSG